jgi:hypothetical protein
MKQKASPISRRELLLSAQEVPITAVRSTLARDVSQEIAPIIGRAAFAASGG